MKRFLQQLGLVGCFLGAGTLAGQAQTEMTISTWVPPTHPIHTQLTAWAKSLEEATGGTLKIELYPAQQLGSAADHYDMVSSGVVEMGLVAPGYTPGRFPLFSYIEIPFTFGQSGKGAGAFHEWYAPLSKKEMSGIHFCMTTMHNPGRLHFKEPGVKKPADLKGKRIRPNGPTISTWLSSLGASTVQAPVIEVRELAERGVIDGVALAWDMLGAEAVMKYHLDFPIYVGGQSYLINGDFYDGLDDAQKAAVDAHCTPEWSERIASTWEAHDKAFLEKIRNEAGRVFYVPTEAEQQEWKDSVATSIERVLEEPSRFGLDGRQILDDLKAKIAERGAGY